jgi:signal transduction histidine kinase
VFGEVPQEGMAARLALAVTVLLGPNNWITPMRFSILRPFHCRFGCLVALSGMMLAGVSRAPANVVPPFSQRTWDRASGLPGNEVSGLCLDRTGYLWISTPTGLARFDGSRFLNYDFIRTDQGIAPGLGAIVGDATGDGIWVAGYGGGLFRFRSGRFEEYALPGGYSQQRVARLFVAGDAALWIAFEGGEVMRLKDGRPEVFGEQFGLGPRRSSQIAADGAGRVWIANGPRLAWYEGGTLQALPSGNGSENVRIASARRDGPWVLTRGRLDKIVAGRVGLSVPIDESFSVRSVQTLLEDSTGAVWAGTRSRGVVRLALPGHNSELAIEKPEDVGALLEDGSGNIWIGSNGVGLIRLRPGGVRHFDKSQGLLESHTLGVCEDNAGTIWIANRDGGVAFVNEQGRARALTPPRLRDTFSARSVVPAGPEGVWVTTSYGLLRAGAGGLQSADAPGMPPQPPEHGEMRIMHQARNGDLWVDLDPGRLGRLRDRAWRVFSAEDGLATTAATLAISEDQEGRIWVGTEESRLYCLEADRFRPVPWAVPAEAGGIRAIYFDAAGRCWLGTAGAGLMRLDAPSGRALAERDGLPSNNLTQIVSDDAGNFWLGSPGGIFHVRGDELEQFFTGKIRRVEAVSLGADEGLGETNCVRNHHPSVWKSRDGMLWFATRQGLVAVDPRRSQVSDTPLVVRVDAARAGDRSWAADSVVHLPASTRTLELDYSVLCLSTPGRVRARYRLEGYEDDWATPETRGLARYSRLPPGEYRFVVEAHLAGVPGSSARARLTIVVLAAWWQTIWFRAGAVAAVLGLGGLMVRAWSHRRLRARLAKLERDSALEHERARIARNIHDDLGSGLTRISLLTQSDAPGDGRTQLDKIYNTVSTLTQSMDEIVWAVNPKNDDLEAFANYLTEYAQGYLADAGIRCRMLLPDLLPARTLTSQGRHHLFLACKEALNNVAKHAQATEVSLQISVTGDELRIVIADNGRGFPGGETAPGAGSGLANMRARLAELGGTCELTSSAGTVVTFTSPLAPPPHCL